MVRRRGHTVFAAIAAAALLLYSCATIEMATPQKYQYTFEIASADDAFDNGDPETRVVLGTSSNLVWEASDKVGTFAAGTTDKYSYVTTSTNPRSFSVYLGRALSAGDKIYFYYPWTGINKDATNVELSIPVEQQHPSGGFDADAMPMVAIPFVAPSDMQSGNNAKTRPIYFCNLASLVEYNIFSPTGKYTSETVSAVRFEADAPIAGGFKFDLTRVDYSNKNTLAISGLGSRTVTTYAASLSIPSSRSSARRVNMAVAPGTFGGTVVVVTNVATYRFPLKSPIVFNRSHTKPLFVDLEKGQRTLNGDVPEGTPALPYSWLELPGSVGENQNYYVGGHSSSSGVRNYSYLYDKTKYTSYWVAYPLYPSIINGSASGSWRADPNLSSSYQVNIWTSTYGVNIGKSSYSEGYDANGTYYARGHQCPRGDRVGNSEMTSQTYYPTNCTPQRSDFNGSIWGRLESNVRSNIPASDTMYVVTGATLQTAGGSESVTIIHPRNDLGKNVPVPNYYWKALLKVKRDASGNVTSACAIAFWLEHKAYPDNNWVNYAISVDALEERTGFDMFVNLPGNNSSGIEATAESNANWTTFKNF